MGSDYLLFKETHGDLGLRNATEFFWNAKGIAWNLVASVTVAKSEYICIGFEGTPPRAQYGTRSIHSTKTLPALVGARDIAENLYFSTHTAAFPPARRACNMNRFYEGSGWEYVQSLKSSYAITPWRGQEAFGGHSYPSAAGEGWYDTDTLNLSVEATSVHFDIALNRYILGIFWNGYAQYGRHFEFPYDWISASGVVSFRVSAVSVPHAGITTSVTLPACFEPAYLNPDISQNPPGNDAIGGSFALTLEIPYWQYD